MLVPTDCATYEDDPTVTWALPESYLALLWDDVIQRVIVYLWYLRLHKNDSVKYPLDSLSVGVLTDAFLMSLLMMMSFM